MNPTVGKPGALKFITFFLLAISCSYGTTEDYGGPEINREKEQMVAEDNYLRRFISMRGQNTDGSDDFSTLVDTNKRNVPWSDVPASYMPKDDTCGIIEKIIKEIRNTTNATTETIKKICKMGKICDCGHNNCNNCNRIRSGRRL